MAKRTWLRNLTAVLIAVVLIGLAVMAVNRGRKQVETATLETNGDDLASGVESLYDGLEYVESVEGKVVFALKSVRTLGLESGWQEIEGVRLEMYDEDAEGSVITCDRASFNKQTRDARLSGGVHVAFRDGSFLETESGLFDSSGRRFVAQSRVVFVGEGGTGTAGRAVYHFAGNRLELDDEVIFSDPDAGSIRASRVLYFGQKSKLVLPEGGIFDLDIGIARADLVEVELAENSGPPNRISLSGNVRFEGASPDGLSRLTVETERVTATRDAGDHWQIEALSQGEWTRLSLLGGERVFARELKTQVLRASLGSEGIINLTAEQNVCLKEIPHNADPRRAEAKSARVWFEDGRASDVELMKEVVVFGEGVEARGYRARLSGSTGTLMLNSNPMRPDRALLVSNRGRIHCDQIHVFDIEDRVEARGNVQGEIHDAYLLGTESADTDDPVHFAAGILEVTGDGADYLLRENARAWQGRRLLLADEIRYRQTIESMRAVGHVRTTFPADQMDAEAETGEDIVVVARSLDYRRLAREAVYLGNVRYNDPEHTMSASELKIMFDENDEITNVEAIGSVEIRDLKSGQLVTGQQARREVASKIVQLTGSPAQATDAKGNIVRGDSLTWNQASGNVTVVGDTETIFYPEDEVEPEGP